jgi:cytochrome c553
LHALAVTVACVLVASRAAVADVNAGAALVQQNGCESCHGAKLAGIAGTGPALYGIEHHRSRAQVLAALENPRAPMPNFGFTLAQAGDIADYLAALDGGVAHDAPTISIALDNSTSSALVTIRFPGAPPRRVSVSAAMEMGGMGMRSPQVVFKPTVDPHVFTGTLAFSMSGAWTLHIDYDGKRIDRPLVVGR